MKRIAAFIIPGLLWVFVSCSSPERSGKDSRLPADSVIAEKKMISLLIDVHLLEGGLMMQRNKGELDRKWNSEAYRKLFIKYRVNRSQFMRNLVYYQKDPKNFTRMYDTILARLDKLRAVPVKKP
ncbi:MAG: DUF4296 domain-containing protein [Bacteroidetes bacterium]|nr:MAG: DUF4296 domain-containing protein [Bacteroidota bacterium]